MRNMNGYLVIAIGFAVVISVCGSHYAPRAATQSVFKLAGARPAIEASQYPDLQAAFDAIPEEGGLL